MQAEEDLGINGGAATGGVAIGGKIADKREVEKAVEVTGVDHAAQLIDEIEQHMPPEQYADAPDDTKPADGATAPSRQSAPMREEMLGTEAAEGHALAHRAGEAEAGHQDWLAAEEVAVRHVPGQAAMTTREVREHTDRRSEAVGEGGTARRVPGRIGRWGLLAAAAAAAGIAACVAYKRRKRSAARP